MNFAFKTGEICMKRGVSVVLGGRVGVFHWLYEGPGNTVSSGATFGPFFTVFRLFFECFVS